MLEVTKEIVIALINNKQIANYSEPNENIEEVKAAIREIYQEVRNTKLIEPQIEK